MNNRVSDIVTGNQSAYSLAEMQLFCQELNNQMYELVFKNVFKGDRNNFNATLEANIDTYDNLMTVIAKYGDASKSNKDITAIIKNHIIKAIKAEAIQLPSDLEERNHLTRVLGDYCRLQIRIAQFRYFYFNHLAQPSNYNKEQAVLAAKQIKAILPKLVTRTDEAATSKHSFNLFGLKIAKFYNEDAASLSQMHEKLNSGCEKLITFTDEIIKEATPFTVTEKTVLPTILADAHKQKSTANKKRLITTEEIYMDKDDMQKKQVISGDKLQNEAITLATHPAMETALDAHIFQSNNAKDLNNKFTELHGIVDENIKIKKAQEEEKAAQASYIKQYLEQQKIEQDKVASIKIRTNKPKMSFSEKIRSAFNIFVQTINVMLKVMLILVIDEMEKAKKPNKTQSSSTEKSISRLYNDGGVNTYNTPDPDRGLTIEDVLINTKNAMENQKKMENAAAEEVNATVTVPSNTASF